MGKPLTDPSIPQTDTPKASSIFYLVANPTGTPADSKSTLRDALDADRAGRRYLLALQTRLSMLRMGSAAVANILMIGDSNTSGGPYYHLRLDLKNQYGDAGIGFVPFGIAEGTPVGNIAMNSSGTWTDVRGNVTNTALGINGLHATTTQVGAWREIVNNDIPHSTEIVLHYIKGPGLGVLRYQIDGGIWTSITCSAGSNTYSTEVISGLSDAAHTIRVELVSTAMTLIGASFHTGLSGVRVHRFGMGGITAKRYAELNGPAWQQAIASFSPNLAVISLGTNDKAQGVTLAEHRDALLLMIVRIRAAAPLCDILLMTPHDNNLTGSIAMSEYAKVQQDVAREQRCAFLDGYSMLSPVADVATHGLLINESGSYYHLTDLGRRFLADLLYSMMNYGQGSAARLRLFQGDVGIKYNYGGVDGEPDPAFYQLKPDGSVLWKIGHVGFDLAVDLTNANGMSIGDATNSQFIRITAFGAGSFGLGIGRAPSSNPFEVQSRAAGNAAIHAVGVGGQSAPLVHADGGAVDTTEGYRVNNVQVVGPQGAAIANADGTLADLTTKFNTLLAMLRTDGKIAP
jgi:hypothetical protein